MCLVIGLWAQTVKSTICLKHKGLSVPHLHALTNAYLSTASRLHERTWSQVAMGNECQNKHTKNSRGRLCCHKPDHLSLISGAHAIEDHQLRDDICGPLQAHSMHR